MDETLWLDDLRPQLPGAVEPAIKLATRTVINEFYLETGYVYNYPPFNTVIGQHTYRLADTADCVGDDCKLPNKSAIAYLAAVQYDGVDMMIVASGEADTENAEPNYVWADIDPFSLVLNVSASRVVEVKAKVSIVPHRAENTILPESLGVQHYQTIIDGVLGHMYKQPSKPYSNASLAQYHLRRFRNGMQKARINTRKGFSTAGLPWGFPKSWS